MKKGFNATMIVGIVCAILAVVMMVFGIVGSCTG